jgi:hypothetical protein
MASLSTAKTAATNYAIAALLIVMLMLTNTLSSGDVSWQRIVGHTGIAILAPLPPLVTLWLGQKLAKTEAAESTLAAGVLLTVILPAIMLVVLLLSAEPLALIGMLFAPLVQAAIGVLTLLAVWLS